MKKLILITGVILIGCVCISALAAPAPAVNETAVVSAQQEEKDFVIKSERGRLVVYRKGESQPFMTTDTFTDSLPKSDKRMLEQGIDIKGENELRKTLEDYCS